MATSETTVSASTIDLVPNILNVALCEGRFWQLNPTKKHRLVSLRYLGEVVIDTSIVSKSAQQKYR
jgi:hypothetical protein